MLRRKIGHNIYHMHHTTHKFAHDINEIRHATCKIAHIVGGFGHGSNILGCNKMNIDISPTCM